MFFFNDARPGNSRPLERGLDFSAMAVPLYWAEGGQVVRVRGSRVALDNIITRYRQGYTPQMIAESYPSVELADILLLISYYLRNKDSVHAYFCEREERAHEISARAFADGLMSQESWQEWCDDRAERLRWAGGEC